MEIPMDRITIDWLGTGGWLDSVTVNNPVTDTYAVNRALIAFIGTHVISPGDSFIISVAT